MNVWRRHAIAMAAIVLALGAIELAIGERIGINGGQGWDGIGYTQWSIDFPRAIDDGLSRYSAQRVLPSAAIYYAGRALDVAPTVAAHVRAFAILDLAALVVAALFWAHIAFAVMRWRPLACWAGFVALFASFANARHALYYPTLTDSCAFLLGMVLAWAYLARRPIAIYVVAVLGAFTWPPLPAIAMAMLVAPRPREPLAPIARDRLARWLGVAAGALLAVVALVAARAYYTHPTPGIGCDKFAKWVRDDLLWLTVPLVAAQLALGAYAIASRGELWNVRGYLRELTWRRTAIAVAACASIVVARALWLAKVGTQGDGPTFDKQFLCEHGNAALRGPVWGLAHHVVYLGPIVIVACLAWRRVAARAVAWGPAAAFGAATIVAMSIGSQSRQWIHLFPLLVALVVAATEDGWTRARLAGFAVLALAWSKLWFHIGFHDVQPWFEMPAQRYYMNLGQWATDETYTWHLGAALVTAAVIAVGSRPWRRSPSAS